MAGVGAFSDPGVTSWQPHCLAVAVTLAKARAGPVLLTVAGDRELSRPTRQLQLAAIDMVREGWSGGDELQRDEAELLQATPRQLGAQHGGATFAGSLQHGFFAPRPDAARDHETS